MTVLIGYYCAHSSLHIIILLTQTGATPLYIASCNGHSDVVNTLIRNGADVNLTYKVHVVTMKLYTLINPYVLLMTG